MTLDVCVALVAVLVIVLIVMMLLYKEIDRIHDELAVRLIRLERYVKELEKHVRELEERDGT